MVVSVLEIVGLALVNALNPCALGALILVLISILLANENKKYKVLLGGLYFTLAVFIGYFIYGVIIIQLFKSFTNFTSVIYPYIRTVLAIIAILLGLYKVKQYISYKPGSFATEMPLRFRPMMRQVIKGISSPLGAFFAGIFVTLFLLPCTIVPYIVASGNLSSLEFIKTLPYLLLYNIIFVLPMIAITLIVYFGISSTEKVAGWRDRNIKKVHLIAGIILIALGIAMLTNLI